MERTRLGQRIFEYRAKHRISQSDMACELGVYLNLVWRLENGKKVHKATEHRLMARLDELERS